MAAADPLESLFSLESAVATSGSLFGDALRERLHTAGPVVASKFQLKAWLQALDDEVSTSAAPTPLTPTYPVATTTPPTPADALPASAPALPASALRRVPAYRGQPGQNLFTTAAGAPLPRTTFNTTLRRRLGHAQRRLPVRLNLAQISAISFRKGCLSTLGALNVPAHRLADHADHSDVASSRIYTVDTVYDRAANSDLIASSFLGGRSV